MSEMSRILFSYLNLSFTVASMYVHIYVPIPQEACRLEDSFVEIASLLLLCGLQRSNSSFQTLDQVFDSMSHLASPTFFFFLNLMYNQNLLDTVSLGCNFRTWDVDAE